MNDALRHVADWISRYETVCMGDTGYHTLIDRIMKNIVQALSFAAEGSESSEAPRWWYIRSMLLHYLGQSLAIDNFRDSFMQDFQ